jgi:hypothetical protein
MQMKVNQKRLYAAFVCIIVLFTFIFNSVFSMAAIAPIAGNGSIRVELDRDEADLPSIEYKLYKVARISSKGELILVGNFSDADISLSKTDAESMRILSTTLKGYITARNIRPDRVAYTNENGEAVFNGLDDAVYLIVGSSVRYGDGYIVPTPVIVFLPKTDTATGEKNNNVVVYEKSTFEKDNELKKIKVLKIWKNVDNATKPDRITVELYKDNVLFDTAVLSKDNNWQTEWSGLKGSDWIVVEKDVPAGYSVKIDQQQSRFVITNTYESGQESTTGKTEPSTENDQHTTSGGGTSEPTTDGRHEKPPIPNTGQSWWPVVLCSSLGMVLILLGFVNRRYEEETEL